jgi:hypothetical protein
MPGEEAKAAESRYVEYIAAEILDTLPEHDGLARRALRHAERQRFANSRPPMMRHVLRLAGIGVMAVLARFTLTGH